MENHEDAQIAQECDEPMVQPLPFILGFLEERENATGPTTSGTYGDIDCADAS